MKWTKTLLLCAVMLAGCTIKIEPLPQKKPAAYRAHKEKHPKPEKTPAPHPTPTPIDLKQPLELEPTGRPTPMIKIPQPLSTASLSSFEKIVWF